MNITGEAKTLTSGNSTFSGGMIKGSSSGFYFQSLGNTSHDTELYQLSFNASKSWTGEIKKANCI